MNWQQSTTARVYGLAASRNHFSSVAHNNRPLLYFDVLEAILAGSAAFPETSYRGHEPSKLNGSALLMSMVSFALYSRDRTPVIHVARWQDKLGDLARKREARTFEILLPLAACVFTFGSIRKQMKNFFVSGMIFLALGIITWQIDLFEKQSRWPISSHYLGVPADGQFHPVLGHQAGGFQADSTTGLKSVISRLATAIPASV